MALNDTDIEILKDETKPEKYVVELRYEKSLNKDEFIKRRNERQKYADVLNFGSSRSEYGFSRQGCNGRSVW